MINKIKVGAIDYSVELKETIEVGNSTGYFGLCRHDQTLIEISSRYSTQGQHQTFEHEMLHATTYEVELADELDDDKEEEIVNRISNMLYQILKDNDLSFLKGNE